MKNFQKYLWAIIDYSPVIITVSFGTYVALETERRSVPIEQLLKWILILLVLIATSQLVDKLRSFRLIEKKIQEISINLQRNHSVLRKSPDRLNIQEEAKDASTIDVLAWSGVGLFAQLDGFFEQKVNSGCSIRFIIVNPSSEAANVIYDNSHYKEIKTDINSMVERYKKFYLRNKNSSGRIELRMVNWVTPYTMIIIDGNKPGGILSLGLNPAYLLTPEDTRRHIIIESQNEREDFLYFSKQYNQLWEDRNTIRVEVENSGEK